MQFAQRRSGSSLPRARPARRANRATRSVAAAAKVKPYKAKKDPIISPTDDVVIIGAGVHRARSGTRGPRRNADEAPGAECELESRTARSHALPRALLAIEDPVLEVEDARRARAREVRRSDTISPFERSFRQRRALGRGRRRARSASGELIRYKCASIHVITRLAFNERVDWICPSTEC
jgi:hypothetical protein